MVQVHISAELIRTRKTKSAACWLCLAVSSWLHSRRSWVRWPQQQWILSKNSESTTNQVTNSKAQATKVLGCCCCIQVMPEGLMQVWPTEEAHEHHMAADACPEASAAAARGYLKAFMYAPGLNAMADQMASCSFIPHGQDGQGHLATNLRH